MIRHMLRSALMAVALGVALMALVGTSKAQTTPPHPLEGLYEVSLDHNGEVISFLVLFKRDGSKWGGEVRGTPIPVTVKELTVAGENSLTGAASADAEGRTVTITLKLEGSKITANLSLGERTATFTATKKETEGKAAATIEGAYDAQAVMEGRDPISVVLTIKRTKPADK